MPSPTDFNLSPYYDDFAESKKFHRILFRPAFAVQARELTQSQTILQNQVERVSDHLFKQGAMVIPGQVSIDVHYTSIKLTSKSAASLSTYNGTTLTGNTSGVVAQVVGISTTDGTDPDTLFVKYDRAGTNNTDLVFTNGETVTSSATGSPTIVVASTHEGSSAAIQQGVYYINGFHIQVDSTTLILDKYTNTPSYRIGLTVTESFVTPNDDNSLNDNAQGVSNTNAPGSHRFKITLTLSKKTLAALDDNNFYEIARVENGIIKTMVRTTEYAVLEDTLARRTFDESGNYVLTNPDFDVREHLVSGNNRGIFTTGEGGSATKLAIGVSPFKAYVNGYESERLGTTFVDVNKARDFDTANNIKTRFTLDNYINVTNVYNTPDVGFVSGAVEAFKTVNLFDTETSVRGTQQSTVGTTVPQIGRAKSRGFEFVTGSETNDIYATTGVYRHYLFDIEMFTHLNVLEATSFTTGEIVSGASSGATGVVQSISSTKSAAATSISVASPGVVTLNAHGFKDGQQISLSGGSFQIDSSAYTPGTYTVRNATTNTFELYGADGTTAQNVTSFASGPTMTHGVVVLSNVKGSFAINETITGQTSNGSATIQPDRLGLRGVATRDISAVKQIGMAGSPTYTSDTDLTSTYGANETIQGNISIANSSANLLGKGTNFTTDLKVGDSITFTNDAGSDVTAKIQNIISQTQATLTANVGGSDVTTAGVVTRRRAKLTNPENNILVFPLPYKTVKTLKTATNSGQTDTNFNVRRQFKGDLSSNGDITISAGTNETFASLSSGDFTVSIMVTGAGGTGAVGDVLNLSGSNHEGDSIFNLGGSPVGKTLTLDFGANFASHTVKILATISRTVADSKTKTLSSNSTVGISSQTTIESGVIGLGKADIYRINNVYMSSGFGAAATTSDTNITSRFDLDNGQRDNFYDIGRLKLKPGAIVPTGRLLVDFDFFSHGSGDYFDVDSYSGVVNYEDIPSYSSDTTGTTYKLRDVIDFRPRVDDASTIDSGSNDRSFDGTGASTIDVPEFGSDITSDLEFYLSRVDKLFLTREGNLRVVEGASDLNPLEPGDLDGHMLLATLNIPAYTLQTEDVQVDPEDNRRYTMRDIGNLETRIKNIEYYTQLSLLEADAQGLQIQDANGFDRFKNGFVVDNFTGHNVGDVGNNDYKLAIDRARGEARTLFNEDNVALAEADDDGTSILSGDRTDANYQKTGDLITLPYSETNYIQQPFATKTENLNPFLVFNWIGDIDLDPPVDEWKETRVAPEIVVNVNGTFDNLAINRGLDNTSISEIPVGTEWNEWQDQWSGNPRTTRRWQGDQLIETTNRDVVQTRSGIRTTLVPQAVRQSLGNRVISVAFVPFIRSRAVSFTAYGMRPNTRVYPFFDNIDVSAYITPDGGSLGGNLVTDSNGSVTGVFAIPDPNVTSNPKWRTGKRVLRLTSSQTNSADSTAVATSAEGDYDAKGLLETTQEAIISSREARTVRTSTTGNRTQTRNSNRVIAVRQPQRDNGGGGNGGGGDPLAQSFIVDEEDGIFITSLDAFFATKSDNIPVKAEIRTMVNGYPGPKVLPFARKWLNPSSVNTSADASTATTFTFDSPVYLQEGVEYAIVLYSDSVDYTAYVARLGDTVIGSNRTVSSQPNIGVLFKSANNRTWTPEQMEDLKFTLKKAVFDTSSTGTLTLTNDTLPAKTLDSNPIRTFNGSSVVRVFHKNHGMHSTNNNVTIAGIAAGTYNGILHSEINGTYTSISNITLDSYDITTSGTATATGDVGGSTVTATQNRMFDVLQLQIGNVVHPNTNISATLRTTSGRSVHGAESPFGLEGTTSAKNVVLSDNLYFTNPRMVASSINETNEMAGAKSMFVNLTISSSNANLSPVIDLKRVNAFAISNRLNQPTVSNTDTFTGDGSTAAFTLSVTPDSVHLLSVKKSGKKLSPVDDFTVSGTTLTLTIAPANGSTIVAKLSNTVDYDDDTAIEGGSSEGSYITKPITLENPSTAIEVRVAASVRSTSSIKMYYRLSGGEETRRIQDIEFTPFNIDGSSDTNVTPSQGDEVIDINFKDYKFSVSDLPEFTSFQIKVVFNGTNSAYPARLKDFRAIALAV
jgi:hypothetical protein